MHKIKKIYQHAGKCDDQQNLKDTLDASMVSNPEGVTDNSPNVTMKSTPVKKPSDRKSLCLFTNILYVIQKIERRCIGAVGSKHRAMKVGTSLYNKKKKRKRNSKINDNIKHHLYAWITCHPEVVQ